MQELLRLMTKVHLRSNENNIKMKNTFFSLISVFNHCLGLIIIRVNICQGKIITCGNLAVKYNHWMSSTSTSTVEDTTFPSMISSTMVFTLLSMWGLCSVGGGDKHKESHDDYMLPRHRTCVEKPVWSLTFHHLFHRLADDHSPVGERGTLNLKHVSLLQLVGLRLPGRTHLISHLFSCTSPSSSLLYSAISSSSLILMSSSRLYSDCCCSMETIRRCSSSSKMLMVACSWLSWMLYRLFTSSTLSCRHWNCRETMKDQVH